TIICKGPGNCLTSAAYIECAADDARNCACNLACSRYTVGICQITCGKCSSLFTAQCHICRWIHKCCLWCRIKVDRLRMCDNSVAIICECPGNHLASTTCIKCTADHARN